MHDMMQQTAKLVNKEGERLKKRERQGKRTEGRDREAVCMRYRNTHERPILREKGHPCNKGQKGE